MFLLVSFFNQALSLDQKSSGGSSPLSGIGLLHSVLLRRAVQSCSWYCSSPLQTTSALTLVPGPLTLESSCPVFLNLGLPLGRDLLLAQLWLCRVLSDL